MKKPILLILAFLFITLKGFAQTFPPNLPLSNCMLNEESLIAIEGAPATYIEHFVLVDPVTDTDIRELKIGFSNNKRK